MLAPRTLFVLVLMTLACSVCHAGFCQTMERRQGRIIVVGTGPGGTGFVRRGLSLCRACEFVWLEEGGDDQVLQWPKHYLEASEDVITRVKRDGTHLRAARFQMLGGGSSGNSGGPISINPMTDPALNAAVDKYAAHLARDQMCSVRQSDPASDLWVRNYREIGHYAVADPFLVDRRLVDRVVGYGATTFCGNHTRVSITRQVARQPRVTVHTHTKVEHIVFDSDKRATGVRLSNGTVVEGEAVVVAGGVFGTYELLVKSGIGSAQDFARASEPKAARLVHENEHVGSRVGDDAGMLLLHDAQTSDASHSADITAQVGNRHVIEHWGPIGLDMMALSLPPVPTTSGMRATLHSLMASVSIVKIAFPPTYGMRLYMDEQGQTRINDDSEVVRAGDLCVDEDTRRVIEASANASTATNLYYGLTQFLGIANYDRQTGCNTKGRRLSSFHFSGGAGRRVLDDNYAVLGVSGLYVADASISDGFLFAAPTTSVFAYGYAVADRFFL